VPTAKDLTAEELEVFRAAARRRQVEQRAALERRKQRAWELARQAATLLREQFEASRVAVFGSLVHPGCFTERSDVDLAAWDLRPQDTFRAMGVVMGPQPGDSAEFGRRQRLSAPHPGVDRARCCDRVIECYAVISDLPQQD
jgi:uncharacterized protein